MGFFRRDCDRTDRRLTPAEKAVLRRGMVEPLLDATQRQKGLHLALVQTSFWTQLAPILAVAKVMQQLEAREPAVARLAGSLIAASAKRERPMPLDQAIASAREQLQGVAA